MQLWNTENSFRKQFQPLITSNFYLHFKPAYKFTLMYTKVISSTSPALSTCRYARLRDEQASIAEVWSLLHLVE